MASGFYSSTETMHGLRFWFGLRTRLDNKLEMPRLAQSWNCLWLWYSSPPSASLRQQCQIWKEIPRRRCMHLQIPENILHLLVVVLWTRHCAKGPCGCGLGLGLSYTSSKWGRRKKPIKYISGAPTPTKRPGVAWASAGGGSKWKNPNEEKKVRKCIKWSKSIF